MQNYINEYIPEPIELIEKAEQVLRKLHESIPIRINEHIIDSNKKYKARDYFKDEIKNSFSYKSKNPNDFSGIYVFYYKDEPVYVGISGTIIRRLKYHLFGKKDNESSFVYLLAKAKYENDTGKKHNGKRKEFPFDDYKDEIQNDMKENWSIKYCAIGNGYELSFIEIYVACVLKSKWNTFKTH
jgi:hypothetical protein